MTVVNERDTARLALLKAENEFATSQLSVLKAENERESSRASQLVAQTERDTARQDAASHERQAAGELLTVRLGAVTFESSNSFKGFTSYSVTYTYSLM